MGKLESTKLSHKLSLNFRLADWEKVVVHFNPYEESKCTCYVDMYGKIADDPTSFWRKHPHRICCSLVQNHKLYKFHLKLFDLDRESYGNVPDLVMDLKLFPGCMYDISDKYFLSFVGHKYTFAIVPVESEAVQDAFMNLIETIIGNWKYRMRKPDAKIIDGAVRLLKSDDIRKGVEVIENDDASIHTRSELKDLVSKEFGWTRDTEFKRSEPISERLVIGNSVKGRWYQAQLEKLEDELLSPDTIMNKHHRINEDAKPDITVIPSEDGSLQEVELHLHSANEVSITSSQISVVHLHSPVSKSQETEKVQTFGGEGDVDTETPVPSQVDLDEFLENQKCEPKETRKQQEFFTVYTEVREEESSVNLLYHQPSILNFLPTTTTEPEKGKHHTGSRITPEIMSMMGTRSTSDFASGYSTRTEIKRLLEERQKENPHQGSKEKRKATNKKNQKYGSTDVAAVQRITTAPRRKTSRSVKTSTRVNSDEDEETTQSLVNQFEVMNLTDSNSNDNANAIVTFDEVSSLGSNGPDSVDQKVTLRPQNTVVRKKACNKPRNVKFTEQRKGKIKGHGGLEQVIRKRMEVLAKELNARESCSSCDMDDSDHKK